MKWRIQLYSFCWHELTSSNISRILEAGIAGIVSNHQKYIKKTMFCRNHSWHWWHLALRTAASSSRFSSAVAVAMAVGRTARGASSPQKPTSQQTPWNWLIRYKMSSFASLIFPIFSFQILAYFEIAIMMSECQPLMIIFQFPIQFLCHKIRDLRLEKPGSCI